MAKKVIVGCIKWTEMDPERPSGFHSSSKKSRIGNLGFIVEISLGLFGGWSWISFVALVMLSTAASSGRVSISHKLLRFFRFSLRQLLPHSANAALGTLNAPCGVCVGGGASRMWPRTVSFPFIWAILPLLLCIYPLSFFFPRGLSSFFAADYYFVSLCSCGAPLSLHY